MNIVDIGANIGYYSLLASSILGGTGSVQAFEPSSENVKLLKASAALNGFTNINIHLAGLSNETGLVKLDKMYSTASSNYISSEIDELMSNEIASVYPLDMFCDDGLSIDIIKIDIDGFEPLVLKGANRTISNHHPIIFTEFAPAHLETYSGIKGEEYLIELLDFGYSITVFTPAGLVECKQEISRVVDCYNDAGVSHVDLLLK